MISLVLAVAMASSDALVTVLNTSNAVPLEIYNEAVQVVERDAAAGKPIQQFVIAVTTDDNEKSKRYLASSRKTIKSLAESKNNPLAWYLLSMETNNRKYMERAANGGNVQALNARGTMLVHQASVARDSPTNDVSKLLREGFECFRKASEQRDPNAFLNVGICYMRGIGCRKNTMLAFECFRSAAQAGHPEAMQSLSICYDRGIGVRENPDMALFWKMRARACRGDKAAAKWLEGRK